jgi:hypothetical protein
MSRDEIVRRIAELDLEFQAGNLEQGRWRTERTRLKELLSEVSEETESEETEPVP